MRTLSACGSPFRIRLLVALAVVAFLAAATLGGQSPPATPQQPTPFRTGVNFVRVDVYPTSKDGRHVADLSAADFEVLENGAPQEIATFEHVIITGWGGVPAAQRIDPDSTRTENQLASDPRRRLFVLFLDTYHVTDPEASRGGLVMPQNPNTPQPGHRDGPPMAITVALTKFLERVVGPDDLVALMTPEMEARQVVFVRRPSAIEDFLQTAWARRFSPENLDPDELRLQRCGLGRETFDRRREEQTIRSVRDLVEHLRGVREERKAVLLVSEGWMLYRPGPAPAEKTPPGPLGIYVGRDGKPRTGPDERNVAPDIEACRRERVRLSQIDDERSFRALLDEANRANTSFYPVDPRGLAASDAPMVGGALQAEPVPPGKDAAVDGARESLARVGLTKAQIAQFERASPMADQVNLRSRLEAMRTLADATDGSTLLSNDLAWVLQRIADDLSAYYLIGYSSTNTKADGTFRRITVRVKRPGVEVRARRGYRAATREELTAGRAVPAAPPDPAAEAARDAIGSLPRGDQQMPFLAEAGHACGPGAGDRAAWWVLGEITAAGNRDAAWQPGATAEITVTDAGGSARVQRVELSATRRSFLVTIDAGTISGEQTLRIAARPGAGSALPVNQSIRISAAGPAPPSAPCVGTPALSRRGPFSGALFQPTADPRFRRQERVRLEVSVSGTVDSVTAQLLDRAGKLMAVPLTQSDRQAPSGRWLGSELALAPLAPGDYVIQMEVVAGATRQKVVRAIRIVP